MSDLKLSLLLACLVVLFCSVLYRFLGPPAVGAGLAGLVNIYFTYRRRRRVQHFEALRELRVEDPADRERLLQTIDDGGLRTSVALALEEDGTVQRTGGVEIYSFPRSYVRVIQRRYWTLWGLASLTMGIAAFLPGISALWRLILLAVGVACTVGVWRQSRHERNLTVAIEIAPSHVAYVGSDGIRYTIPFYPKVSVEVAAPDADLLVRPPASQDSLFISQHLVGFKRLRSLVYKYSGTPLPPTEPSTPDS